MSLSWIKINSDSGGNTYNGTGTEIMNIKCDTNWGTLDRIGYIKGKINDSIKDTCEIQQTGHSNYFLRDLNSDYTEEDIEIQYNAIQKITTAIYFYTNCNFLFMLNSTARPSSLNYWNIEWDNDSTISLNSNMVTTGYYAYYDIGNPFATDIIISYNIAEVFKTPDYGKNSYQRFILYIVTNIITDGQDKTGTLLVKDPSGTIRYKANILQHGSE